MHEMGISGARSARCAGARIRTRLAGLVGAGAAVALALAAAPAVAGLDPVSQERIPRQIPYRGVLEQNGAPVDGAVLPMTFALFDVQQGGVPLWTEDHVSVAVQGGRFSVALGEYTRIPAALFTQADLYLEVSVAGSLLQGRQRLYSVPYAHYAAASSATPAGSVVAFMGTVAPAGWLFCDGQSTTAAEYPALARALGKTGTFLVPDLRGSFLRGVDPSGSADPEGVRAPGLFQGWATAMPRNALTTGIQDQPHTHNYWDSYWSEWSGNYLNSGIAGHSGTTDYDNRRFATEMVTAANNENHAHPIAGGDAETRPNNVAVRWIIKAVD